MTTAERVEAVLRHVEMLKKERYRRTDRILEAVSVVSGMLLLLCIVILSGGGSMPDMSYYGSSLLLEGAGGYVLTAVLAFAAAVALTLICVRYKDRKQKDPSEKKDE